MEKWWQNKLFHPKDIEGEPVKEQFDYIRELFNMAVKKDPRMKAVTIIGSTLKGYARPGKEGSDIDIAPIYDDSAIVENNVTTFNFRALYDAKVELKDMRDRSGLPSFKVEEVIKTDINHLTPERIRKIDNLGTLWTIEGLFFPGVGDLETYRKIVRDEINKYSPEEKEIWIQKLTDFIVKHLHSNKFIESGMIEKKDEKSFLESREKLIEARVRRIFG